MKNSERAAYLRGLFEGMELDPEKKETKLFSAVIDLLDDLAAERVYVCVRPLRRVNKDCVRIFTGCFVGKLQRRIFNQLELCGFG